jgi:hypothetical protein
MRDSGAMRDGDARGGATMRAIRAMPTEPDASEMAAAKAVTEIVEGINPIGTATGSGVAAKRHPGSAVANALPSAPVIATVPSARPSIAKTATATSPRRLVRTPPGEWRTQRLLRKGVPSARKAAVAAAAGAGVDGAAAVVVRAKASHHRARQK